MYATGKVAGGASQQEELHSRSITLLQQLLPHQPPCAQPTAPKILPLSCKHLLAWLKPCWFSVITLQVWEQQGTHAHLTQAPVKG